MHGNFKTPYRSFAQALAQLIEDGDTCVKECASIGGCSGQTIRNWISELTPVNEEVAHRLMRQHPNEKVRRGLAEARLSGSEFHVTTAEGETDLDRDGRTTCKDAILASVNFLEIAVKEHAEFVRECSDGLTDEEVQRAANGYQQLIQHGQQMLGILAKAKPQPAKFRGRLIA